MEKPITVKELLKLCQEQLRKGNGDKQILISNDDEGNGYHSLYYEFTDDEGVINELSRLCPFHDHNDPKDVVILG